MANKKKYVVEYERDADGDWTAVIDRSQGVSCVSQGKSLSQARARIRDALALYLDDEKAAEAAEFEERFKLSEPVKRAIAAATAARSALRKIEEEAAHASMTAVTALAKVGLSRRDTAELLGVSFQRVQQLVEGAPRRATAAKVAKRAKAR